MHFLRPAVKIMKRIINNDDTGNNRVPISSENSGKIIDKTIHEIEQEINEIEDKIEKIADSNLLNDGRVKEIEVLSEKLHILKKNQRITVRNKNIQTAVSALLVIIPLILLLYSLGAFRSLIK